jgi:hypothetical protein
MNYQEPIEKEDIDVEKKFREAGAEGLASANSKKQEKAPAPENAGDAATESAKEKPADVETSVDKPEEKISEKMETARRTLQARKPAAQASVSDDAGTISQITEYERKVDKLVELALQKGPEHAIKVAQHMDKEKNLGEADNYTLDAIHDRLLEEELRNQLIQKGLLKEL